jgi:hypothetical protein
MVQTTAALESMPVNRTSTSARRSTAKSAHPGRRRKPVHADIQYVSSTTRRTPQHPPACALAITLDREPLALRSTRNPLRTAVRRGAARPPAKRPGSCPAVQAPVRFGVPAASWCQDVRIRTVPWRPCPRPPSASPCPVSPSGACLRSVRPSSVWLQVRVQRPRPVSIRPASGVRVRCPPVQRPASGACLASACPGSARPVPGVRVRCPVPRDVQCPVWTPGVRCERPASVRVTSVSARPDQ